MDTNLLPLTIIAEASTFDDLKAKLSSIVGNVSAFPDIDKYFYLGYAADVRHLYTHMEEYTNFYGVRYDLFQSLLDNPNVTNYTNFYSAYINVSSNTPAANRPSNETQNNPAPTPNQMNTDSGIVTIPRSIPTEFGSVDTRQVSDRSYVSTSSFAGSDMIVDFVFPDMSPIRIGTASTVTVSTFREKRQVRTIGRINTKGIVKGPRTIGGTLIFTVIDQHVVNNLLRVIRQRSVKTYQPYDTIKLKMDELPPFDIVISLANEYGQSGKMVIYGCHVIDDSMTLSIEDMLTENTMTYIARDYDAMKGPIDPKMNLYTENGYAFGNYTEPTAKFSINKVDSRASFIAYQERLRQLNSRIFTGG